ncbi:MurR/RpiR family transcriptional regulator [Floccifex sp.]|uniref:MurR/RpiR family transcriptional regulator n=1 Tax=Floccifex sp. TaxID=2815810 RepID=UPI003F035C6D
MKNALLRLREYQETLTPTEKQIADYIIDNARAASSLTIRELAEEVYSSPSTIVRLCKKIGFEGFNDFQKALLYDIASLSEDDMKVSSFDIKANEDTPSIINKITYNNIRILEESIKLLDEETISACVDLLEKANRVLLFGIGSSYYVSRDLYLKLLRLNISAVSNEDFHSQLLAAINSNEQDVAIVFSYSGQTKEMIDCIETLKENKTPVIAFTRYTPSTIAEMADYNLYVASTEPILRKGAMTSRIAFLNVIDILYTIYLTRHYDETMKKILKTHIYKDSEK